jgi:hypothetical protein
VIEGSCGCGKLIAALANGESVVISGKLNGAGVDVRELVEGMAVFPILLRVVLDPVIVLSVFEVSVGEVCIVIGAVVKEFWLVSKESVPIVGSISGIGVGMEEFGLVPEEVAVVAGLLWDVPEEAFASGVKLVGRRGVDFSCIRGCCI